MSQWEAVCLHLIGSPWATAAGGHRSLTAAGGHRSLTAAGFRHPWRPARRPGEKISLHWLSEFATFPPVTRNPIRFLAALTLSVGFISCSSQVTTKQPVSYRNDPGYSADLTNGLAFPPSNAPNAVKHAFAAANRLQRVPYKWGGGHAQLVDYGYDCSGSVSYVLRAAGIIDGSLQSREYCNYGLPGPGRWITIYACRGHVFMTVAGLRLDTGGGGGRSGPRWKPESREANGYVMRHPEGF